MEKLETEVKFYLSNIKTTRKSILGLGAISQGRFFETNLRFEDKNKSLIQKKSLLRLRKDAKTTLTFKSSPPRENKKFKIFKELEVEVGDFSTMNQILESLGFHSEQKYEKWRDVLVLKQTHFCLDTMPYGDFLEIEGRREDIKNFATRLSLNWNKRILLNYLEMFEIIREKLRLPFSDLTFKNFEKVKVDMSKFLDFVEAGNS